MESYIHVLIIYCVPHVVDSDFPCAEKTAVDQRASDAVGNTTRRKEMVTYNVLRRFLQRFSSSDLQRSV